MLGIGCRSTTMESDRFRQDYLIEKGSSDVSITREELGLVCQY